MNQNTYLITGGCGFIGSHVIDELLKDNADIKIINIDKLGIGSNVKNVPEDPRIVNYYTDICDDSLHYVFEKHKPSYIIHLAAESHVDRSITDPLSFVDSNVKGTANVLECVRRIVPESRMVHVSTDEVYGHLHPGEDPFVESTPISPRSPYSASKAGSDVLALSYRNTYNIDITVTRCCNNYGPRQHSEKLIPTIFRTLTQKKKVPVYGDGKNIREWIYVVDHAKALIEVLHKASAREVYNIYGVSRKENITLIEMLIKELIKIDNQYDRGDDVASYIEFVKDRPGHDFCYKMSTLYEDINALKAQRDFNSGLVETILYYKYRYEKEN